MMEYLWKDRKRTLFGLPWSFTKYALTEERFFVESGLISSKEDEVRLYRILDISLTRSLYQKIFGLGTIHCCSSDKTLGDFDIKNVKKPKEVKELFSAQIEKQRDAKRVVSREYMDDDDHDADDLIGDEAQ